MQTLPDFNIQRNGKISETFLEQKIYTFHQAIQFVRELPYGRNSDKEHLQTVLTDGKGTCSTKHALLKTLADENAFPDLRLMLGIFRMHAGNTAPVAQTLASNGLTYIPEAHMYLMFGDERFDFTRRSSKPSDFVDDLIVEQELEPSQINQYKIALHKKILADWIKDEPAARQFSLDEIWKIREQCIQDLANYPNQQHDAQ